MQESLKILLIAALALFGRADSSRAEDASSPDTALSYNQVVRPILADNCIRCHGPDEGERQADLRLDQPADDRYEELIARITSDDPDAIMPPPESNKSLSSEQIETLKRWISEGADYEEHWSFIPPQKASVPADAHPVDYFIDRQLAKQGLSRSQPANPYTRIRRVYLDLVGLPPSIEEADAFAADPSPKAYAAIVDRLLASPRYGERWRDTGSTWPAMPTPTATRKTAIAASGPIATG